MKSFSKKILAATVATIMAWTLGPASRAFGNPPDGEGIQPGVDSPALSSTNATPTLEQYTKPDGTIAYKTVPPAAKPGFRVLPYLQKPASDQMTINFYTESGSQATVVVKGPGLPAEGKTFTVDGTQNPVNVYEEHELTQGDLKQPAGGATLTNPLTVPQGTWIRAENPYKYSVTVDGLTADSDYTYSVAVDGYKHDAKFSTFQAGSLKNLTKPIHIIAFSDTETDQVGRVTYREWVKAPLAEGSEARPDALDSQWAKTFGENKRDGENQLRYMLTEDRAQEENNKIIAAQNPDLLIIAGDIAERGSNLSHWDEWFRYFAGDHGHLLDSIPISTSLGNHEVYGYCESAELDGCVRVVRARAHYNDKFDTFGSDNPAHRDAYHRTDLGPITVISIDSTNSDQDQTPKSDTITDAEKITWNDVGLTPEQYGTDTQNAFTIERYAASFKKAVANGWFGEGADPDAYDQPDFMPDSEQYQWLEAQLQDARNKGQTIIVQYHHVAYSNGTHGTTMGHQLVSDAQPGTPMRHLQPLWEQYDVAVVISGHDEMFQASFVDEADDGTGVFHWDVGVASDGLRGEKMMKNAAGEYVPFRFNSHSIWMSQTNEPEMWKTNDKGVKHLVSGGKHYGHLDMWLAPYSGAEVPGAVATLTMTPVAAFPVLNDDYSLNHVERREMESGKQVVYLDADGKVLPQPKAPKYLSLRPEPTVEYGDWVDGDKDLETKTVAQTRTVITTDWTWEGLTDVWTQIDPVETTEEGSRPMTPEEIAALEPTLEPTPEPTPEPSGDNDQKPTDDPENLVKVKPNALPKTGVDSDNASALPWAAASSAVIVSGLILAGALRRKVH